MTSLAVVARLLPSLSQKTAFFALYKAVKEVADNCAGKVPRMLSESLDTEEHSLETLTRWFRRWVEHGHVVGCERVILSVAKSSATLAEISNLFFNAATNRIYASSGHGLDLGNKGLELIEFLGRDYADKILPLVVRGIEEQV